MPYLTDWLEMPSASSQPGPSLFDPPALRSMGTRRGRVNESMQAAQTQKMAAYQAQMRKMEMQKLADDEARAVLPVLQSLDINSPDYIERRGQLFSQFPLSVESPAVSNVAKAHDDMLLGIRQQQDAKIQREREVMDALDQDPSLRPVFESELRLNGPEAAKMKVATSLHNRKQEARLLEAGFDVDQPGALQGLMNEAGYLDTAKVDRIALKNKGSEKGIPQGAAEAYQKAIGLASSGIPEDEKAGKFMLNFLDARHPELKNFAGSSLPDSTASDTGKPAASGAFTVTPKTTREEIAKLPSGTRITMPDGTVKFKK